MIPALGPVALALLVAGCAPLPPAPEGPRPPPASAYAADPFVPVNLYLNSTEQVDEQHRRLADYAARRLDDSKAFTRLDRGVMRWPITLQGRYRVADADAGADRWRRIAGALTLGLVPVRVARVHTLVVEVWEEPDIIATLEFTVTRPDRRSLYDLGDPDRDERAAVDELCDRLLAQLAARRLVPRWNDFKPEPKRKRAPPKVPGRET